MGALRLPAAILLAALAAACARYDVVEADRVSVSPHYSIAPAGKWNRRDSGGLLYWTIDGPLLHQIIIIPGVAPGGTLFPVRGTDRRRKRKFRPRFDAGMTPPEIAEYFEASMVQSGAVSFRMKRAAPARFGGAAGFEFDFDYLLSDGLERVGFAVGAVHRDTLLMIIHLAARRHYDATYRPRAKRLIESVRLTRPGTP